MIVRSILDREKVSKRISFALIAILGTWGVIREPHPGREAVSEYSFQFLNARQKGTFRRYSSILCSRLVYTALV
jgi:hypothetical protein